LSPGPLQRRGGLRGLFPSSMHPRFIAGSFLPAWLVGKMYSRFLPAPPRRAPYVQGEASHTPERGGAAVLLRLSFEGSVLAVVLALLAWGILALGSEGVVATERHTLLVEGAPPSLVSCFAPNPSGAGAESSTTRIGEGGPCPTKQWPHTTTSRRPRAGGEILDQEARREDDV
jgi:hypothetical protein